MRCQNGQAFVDHPGHLRVKNAAARERFCQSYGVDGVQLQLDII